MSINLEDTLATIKERQWTLSDFDWDAPGADLIDDERRSKLKAFMSDLVWIEHVGARGFAALADLSDDPTLTEIYRWFHAEEQRHANAELALMKRWGMLEEDELPAVNANIRLIIDWLDANARSLSLGTLSAVIAVLEVALDGALVKFLVDEIEDPLCHEVFRRINADEARHLAVDFEVMEMMGMRPWFAETLRSAANLLKPSTIIGIAIYFPLLERMRRNVIGMGIKEEKLSRAIERFGAIGGRSEATRRYLPFILIREHAKMVTSRMPAYQVLSNGLLAITSRIPVGDSSTLPGWVKALSSRPYA